MNLINDNGCGWLNQLSKRINIKTLNEDLTSDYLIIGNDKLSKSIRKKETCIHHISSREILTTKTKTQLIPKL